MKYKLLAVFSLLLIFSVLFSAQLTRHVHADDELVSGPVTGPITGPITGPLSLFKISGHVLYHFIGLFVHGAARFQPAAGVTVKAVDIFTGHMVTTTTDTDGDYTLDPGQKGFYKVSVSGGETSLYVPPLHMVNDNKPAGKQNIDFKGLVF